MRRFFWSSDVTIIEKHSELQGMPFFDPIEGASLDELAGAAIGATEKVGELGL